jgi:hypothetical protein
MEGGAFATPNKRPLMKYQSRGRGVRSSIFDSLTSFRIGFRGAKVTAVLPLSAAAHPKNFKKKLAIRSAIQ